jgi:hypothetical protein
MVDHIKPTWEQTYLWDQLNARSGHEAQEARRVASSCLPEIERLLHSGGTAPLDFTLHDEEHSFRVAQRMTEIIPQDVLPALSEYELALLLLSAYLHDIGMTPERGRVKEIYRYFATGESSGLDIRGKGDIQEWLDNEGLGTAGKLVVGDGHEETLEQAVTHYCRHKHNDWSEEWIRRILGALAWNDYVGWLDDLVLLCRSHHYGYSDLKAEAFDPRLVGPGPNAKVVHRRYLGCVLRVADILEFDPERTPDVIFRHRAIPNASKVFWYKDHYVNRVISTDLKSIFIAAEPPDAKIHRAIIEMIDGIDGELTLCRRLASETHFEKFGPLPDLHHRWDLPYVVDRRVQPKADRYVYTAVREKLHDVGVSG